MKIELLSRSDWKRGLPDTGVQVFHYPGVLSVLEEYAGAGTLHLLGGYKGDRLVGLLPLFVKQHPFGMRVITSPPPGMHVPHMGPVLMPASPKVSKRERLNRTFIDGVMERIGVDSLSMVFMVCSPQYSDPRPYRWDGFDVDVSFTYHVPAEVEEPEQILKRFSKSRRREVRRGAESDVTIELGGLDEARQIYEQTQERFAEQDEYFGVTWPYVRDVIRALEDRSRIYVARGPDGAFLSGIIVLYSNEAGSFWLGGVRTTYDNISMNSLLHWNIIRDIVEHEELDSVGRYDMVGAGESRLAQFKSKFAPELQPYYVVDSGGLKMRAAKTAYRLRERVRQRVVG